MRDGFFTRLCGERCCFGITESNSDVLLAVCSGRYAEDHTRVFVEMKVFLQRNRVSRTKKILPESSLDISTYYTCVTRRTSPNRIMSMLNPDVCLD